MRTDQDIKTIEAMEMPADERQMAMRLEAERDALKDEWARRYDTPPWRSLERMYREAYPGRDVVHGDILRWADTFIAARREMPRESGWAAEGPSDALALAMARAERAEADAATLRAALKAIEQECYGDERNALGSCIHIVKLAHAALTSPDAEKP